MSISTGAGDDGSTGLFYGGRVGKDATGPEAYGTVDETVSVLGVARAAAGGELATELLGLQRELFVVGAELATAPGNHHKLVDGVSRTTAAMVARLDVRLDALTARGAPTEFIVPGGTVVAAAIDHARSVVRRAERRVVAHHRVHEITGSQVVPYLNRLNDLLYMLARTVEGEWTPSREDEPG